MSDRVFSWKAICNCCKKEVTFGTIRREDFLERMEELGWIIINYGNPLAVFAVCDSRDCRRNYNLESQKWSIKR